MGPKMSRYCASGPRTASPSGAPFLSGKVSLNVYLIRLLRTLALGEQLPHVVVVHPTVPLSSEPSSFFVLHIIQISRLVTIYSYPEATNGCTR